MTASGEIYPDKLCALDEEKPATSRKCVTKAKGCNYEWYASQWSEVTILFLSIRTVRFIFLL